MFDDHVFLLWKHLLAGNTENVHYIIVNLLSHSVSLLSVPAALEDHLRSSLGEAGPLQPVSLSAGRMWRSERSPISSLVANSASHEALPGF